MMRDHLERFSNEIELIYRCGEVFALCFAVLLVLQLLRRVLAGASLSELIQQRFYECPPIRGLLVVALGTIWLVVLGAAAVAFGTGLQAWKIYDNTHAINVRFTSTAIAAALLTLALHVLRRLFLRWMTEFSADPPKVAVEVQYIKPGIAPRLFARLGAESFPNQIGHAWRVGLWVRRLGVLVFAGAGVWIILIHALEMPGLQRDIPAVLRLQIIPLSLLEATLEAWRIAIRQAMSLPTIAIVGYLGLLLFLQFRSENRNYLLLKFAHHWSLLITTALLVVLAVLSFFGARSALIAATVMLFLCAGRLRRDLALARSYRARQRVVSPIIAAIRRRCTFLEQLPKEPSLEYPQIDAKELSLRITDGAKNLEEAGPLVTRNFGRYLRLARVQHERCAVATLQFLTVARKTAWGRWWPTSNSLCSPTVPVWDLRLFPLNPPTGYQPADQQWELDSQWNVVATCGGGCNGTGIVYVTESYQDTETHYGMVQENGRSRHVMQTVYVTKTRQVRTTCGTCNGTGRLEHTQVLNTGWRLLNCRATSPAFAMPELIEGAEEVEFFQMPYVEAKRRLPAGKCTSALLPTLSAEVEHAAQQLAEVSEQHSDSVLKALDADFIYRSRFVVRGFHTIRISFGTLIRQRGWFFGKRPEFHFPSLPLSWGMIGTRLLLPPALIWLLYWYVMIAWQVASRACSSFGCGDLFGAP